jgi:hypothetical protein
LNSNSSLGQASTSLPIAPRNFRNFALSKRPPPAALAPISQGNSGLSWSTRSFNYISGTPAASGRSSLMATLPRVTTSTAPPASSTWGHGDGRVSNSSSALRLPRTQAPPISSPRTPRGGRAAPSLAAAGPQPSINSTQRGTRGPVSHTSNSTPASAQASSREMSLAPPGYAFHRKNIST